MSSNGLRFNPVRVVLDAFTRAERLFDQRPRASIDLTTLLRCKRLFYFEVREERGGVEPDASTAARVAVQRIMGKILHSFIEIEGCIKEFGFEVCNKSVCIRMRPDFWCPEHRTVVEVKTVGRMANLPRLNHLAQLYTYMHFLSADLGYLVYVSRTTGEVKAYEFRGVRLPREAVERLFGRAEEFANILQGGSGAPLPEPGLWCRNCHHANKCSGSLREAGLKDHELMQLLRLITGKT